MIATILPGSSNFHAVGYNERKVSKGVARLIEILNFGSIGTFGKPTTDELVKYLQEYSSSNERIQKAQFHLAISCKGKEMSENELLDFAHKYLKEMGYMEPGQPILRNGSSKRHCYSCRPLALLVNYVCYKDAWATPKRVFGVA